MRTLRALVAIVLCTAVAAPALAQVSAPVPVKNGAVPITITVGSANIDPRAIQAFYSLTTPSPSPNAYNPLQLDSLGNLKVTCTNCTGGAGGSSVVQYNATLPTPAAGATLIPQADQNGRMLVNIAATSTTQPVAFTSAQPVTFPSAQPVTFPSAQPVSLPNVTSAAPLQVAFPTAQPITAATTIPVSAATTIPVSAATTIPVSAATTLPVAFSTAQPVVFPSAQPVAFTTAQPITGTIVGTTTTFPTATPTPAPGTTGNPFYSNQNGDLRVAFSTAQPVAFSTAQPVNIANVSSSSPLPVAFPTTPAVTLSGTSNQVSITNPTLFPFVPGAQPGAGQNFLGAACQYSPTLPTLTSTNNVAPCQIDSQGHLLTSASLTPPLPPTPTAPPSTGSGFTAHGIYNSAPPAVANGYATPLQTDGYGTLKAGLYAANGTTAVTVGTGGGVQVGLCGINSTTSNCASIGTNGSTFGTATQLLGTYGTLYAKGYNGNNQPVAADGQTGGSGPGQAVPVFNPGGSLKTVLTSASPTACTSIAVAGNGGSRFVDIMNAGISQTSVTVSIYDEGASPTCAAADLVWSGTVPAANAKNFQPPNLPMSNGIAVTLSAALSSNVIIARN